MSNEDLVRFQPFTSTIEGFLLVIYSIPHFAVPFWFEFTKKKLDELRLSEEAVTIHGFTGTGQEGDFRSSFNFTMEAFNRPFSPPSQHFGVPGTLRNYNTIQSFKAADKKQLLADATKSVRN